MHQILLQFNNGKNNFIFLVPQTWSVGNNGGTKDPKEVILDKGEYLVRVTHEKLQKVVWSHFRSILYQCFRFGEILKVSDNI